MQSRLPRRAPWRPLSRYLVLAALLGALPGCSGARPDLTPWVADYQRTRSEAETLLDTAEDPPPILERAAASRAQGAALITEGRDPEAEAALRRAVAEARVALSWGSAIRSSRDAAECGRQAAEARREWQDALAMLEQAEKVTGRRSRAVIREAPPASTWVTQGEIADPYPLDAGDARERLAEVPRLKEAAADVGVAVSDLENTVVRERQLAATPKMPLPLQEEHLLLAGMATQEMEYRIEAARNAQGCARALELAREYSTYRDGALWAMVELERSMKESVRKELEEERARLEDRQNKLFEALQQFEGKFASIKRDARGTIMSLKDILFDFDKATLKRDAEFNLVKITVILQQFPEMHIGIEGHTDNIGTEEYNQKLSERRAQAVRDFLLSQGIEDSRMNWVGYGMTQPVASNATEEGRALNRRVDLVIAEE